jgi:hypothetical protein
MTTSEIIAGAGLAGVLAVGTWVGTISTTLEHKVNASDFSRVEQKIEDQGQNISRIEEDVDELKQDQKEILDILRRVEAQQGI